MKDYRTAYNALMKFYPLTLDDLAGEEWRNVKGYEGYQISNYGRVKSFKRYTEGKILKLSLTSCGYLQVCLCNEEKKYSSFVHRLVAEVFIPNIGAKPQVNHIDGCKLNNHVSNLEWVSQAENQQHAFDTGLQKGIQGADNVLAKLSEDDVSYIRENPEDLSVKSLAEMFKVGNGTISNVQLGKTYRNASGSIRNLLRIPENICQEIAKLFVKGDAELGAEALARKYGIGATTVRRIVKKWE